MEPNIARVLLNTNNEDKKLDKTSFPSCQFEPSMMVDMFPGPALLVDGDMNVKHHNIFAKGLLGPIRDQEAFLKSMISRCLSNICPDTQKTTLDDSSGLRHYDLYAFPIKQDQIPNQAQNPATAAPLVFLFGRETTVEHNLTNALVDSRQMFKDLVSCSTDFAWETDNNGNFIYVSPKGILGYTAFELNGRNAQEMIIGAETRNPFDTLDKVTEMELWLKRADGSMACLLVSAVPVLDSHATWQGARGVCRDITHIREKEALLRRTNKREHILNKIISTIRNITSPADMMENALKAAMEGIKADYACILEKTSGGGGDFTAAVRQEQGTLPDQDLIYTLCLKAREVWQNCGKNIGKTQIFQLGTLQVMMGITSHHAKDNGAIFLIRQKNDWQDAEIHLFNGITTHLGIAIEQVITHKELERRAFTDDLTGLLNRRAFTTEVTKRIKSQVRNRTTGALLYIDLDNFKNVNDTKGHAHGDRILQELARIINENIRIGDYSARLGGDEFAIWLDDVSAEDAMLKSRKFIAAGSQLAQIAGVTGPQLSISVGLALCRPDNPQTFDDLMKNSDDALYQAKSAGKATCVMYDPNASLTTDPITGQQKEEPNA